MKKINIKKICIVSVVVLVIIAIPLSVYAYNYNGYKSDFNKAMSQLNEEKYEEAISGFNKLSSTYFGKKDKDIKANIENAKKFKENKKTYDEALKLVNEKKYLEAMEIFKKIPKEDKKRVDLAKKKTDECKTLYIALNLENAKKEAKASKYDSALNYLTLVLNLDSTNKDATALKDEYTKAKEAVELKAKKEAEEKARKEEEAKKAASIPEKRPFCYVTPLLSGFHPKFKMMPVPCYGDIPDYYYDWNATFEIVVHLKGREKRFSGKVAQELTLDFDYNVDKAEDENIARVPFDLIINDKYGLHKSGGEIINFSRFIIPAN